MADSLWSFTCQFDNDVLSVSINVIDMTRVDYFPFYRSELVIVVNTLALERGTMAKGNENEAVRRNR